MLKKLAATLALVVGIGAVGITAVPQTADAHRIWIPGGNFHRHFGGNFGNFGNFGHFGHFRHFGGPFFGGYPIYIEPPIVYDEPIYYGPGPCWRLRNIALRTGSRYWWHRWHVCRFGY